MSSYQCPAEKRTDLGLDLRQESDWLQGQLDKIDRLLTEVREEYPPSPPINARSEFPL